MIKPPNIETKNCSISIPKKCHASLLRDFYLINKEYLQPWEPERDKDFYTLNYWQNQVNLSNQLFVEKKAVKLIAISKDKSQIIGVSNFNNIVWGCFLACHLGYSIDQSHQRKGLMHEILEASINYIKKEFKLHRIMANHLPNNYRSEKLLKRLGFKKEGLAKDYLRINGKWQDHVLNSLILTSD